MAYGLVSAAPASEGSHRCAPWLSHRISNHKSPRSHSRPHTYSFLPPAKRGAASNGRNSVTLACPVVGTCVMKRTCAVSEDQICCVFQIRSIEGRSVRAVHVFVRGEYQVTESALRVLIVLLLVMCLSSSSCLTGCSKPISPVRWL